MKLINIQNTNHSKYINYIIIAYAFSLPLSRAGLSIFSVLMIVLWILEGDFKRKYEQLKDNGVVLSLLFLIVFGYLSLLWTGLENIQEGLKVATKTLRVLFLPMIVIATTLKKEYLSKVITAFLSAMIISEILSYGIFFEFWSINGASPHDPTPFMHHLDYSTFLAFTSLLLLNRFFHTNTLKLKIFYFTYFLFVTSNLFISGGRTGQLAFGVSIFVVGFIHIKHKLVAFLSSVIFATILFTSAYNLSPNFEQRVNSGYLEVENLFSVNSVYSGSIGSRVGLWIISMEVFKEHPLLGVGVGSISDTIDNFVKKNPDLYLIDVRSMHNTYFHYLSMLGLIGLIAYLSIWYNLYKLKSHDDFYYNLKIIFISVICVASLTEILFHNQFPMSLFALFVGVFIMLNIKQKKSSYENR